jgi:hypothetical protein
MSEKELAELKKTIQSHERRISDLESLKGKKPAQIPKEISVKEFILDKKRSSDPNKALTIGYYLEKLRKISPFTIRDLEQLFREAREPLPSNTNDVVNQDIAKGFMMEAEEKKDGRKAWTLTSTGEKFVENGLKEAD